MKRKMLLVLAAAGAVLAASVASLPAGAHHGAGFQQDLGAELRLPAVNAPVVNPPDPELCVDFGDQRLVCEKVATPPTGGPGTTPTSLALEWAYTVLGSSTHLPDTRTATGHLACPAGAANASSPGIVATIDPSDNQRYNTGYVVLKINDAEAVRKDVDFGGSTPGTPVSLKFLLDC